MESILGERLKNVLKIRNVSARWLALRIETNPTNISHYCNGKSCPEVLNLVVKMAEALNVSTDYLLGLSDDMTHAPCEKTDTDEFSKRFSHLFADPDFIMYAGVYNALPPEAKVFLTDYVRSLGIFQNVLSEDGLTVLPQSHSNCNKKL